VVILYFTEITSLTMLPDNQN